MGFYIKNSHIFTRCITVIIYSALAVLSDSLYLLIKSILLSTQFLIVVLDKGYMNGQFGEIH